LLSKSVWGGLSLFARFSGFSASKMLSFFDCLLLCFFGSALVALGDFRGRVVVFSWRDGQRRLR
jgi:hypothetical protein